VSSRVAALLALLAAAVAMIAVDVASARPVRVGRYTEIPYGVPDEPWVTGSGGPRRASRSRYRAPIEEPTKRWRRELRSSRPSPPLVLGAGELYVASSTGVTALGSDGAIRWSVRLGFVAATPSLSPTRDLVVGTNAGALVTLGTDGRVRGRTIVGGAVRSSPLVLDDGSVVITAFDQATHRFDAEGRRVFRVSMNAQTNEPPAWTSAGTLLVPAADWLHVMSPRGDRLASHTVGATIIAGPAIADDGTIWALAQDASLHQLSPRGGRLSRTELEISVSSDTGIAVGVDGAVRVPGRDGGVVCVGPTGTERWRVTGEGGFPGALTLDAADMTLAVNDQGRLIAIDAEGEIAWRVALGGRTNAAPVVGPDGTIYVVTTRGEVQAWR